MPMFIFKSTKLEALMDDPIITVDQVTKQFPGPVGAPRMRENRVGRPPTSEFLGAGEAVKQFDAGSRFKGLRIVATSTRVRLFPLFPAGSRGRPSPSLPSGRSPWKRSTS